jgi:Trypsin
MRRLSLIVLVGSMLAIFDHSSLRRKLVTAAATVTAVAALAVAQPAYGIINGIPDGTRHPNAGLMVADYHDGTHAFCTGFLISPQYFATAAHCIYFAQRDGRVAADFQVTFDEKYATAKTWYQAAAISYDPKFVQSISQGSYNSVSNDYGLIKLTKAVKGITPTNLPPLNYVNTLPTGQPILETVGYGITNYDGSTAVFPAARHYAVLSLTNGNATSTDNMLKVSEQHTGVCFGDSGGPTYVGNDTRVVLAITSILTSSRCEAWSHLVRLDLPDAHSFFGPYD